MKKKYLKTLFLLIILLQSYNLVFLNAEPYIILKYSDDINTQNSKEGGFGNNEDFSTQHTVKNNETLSDIIEKYYSKGNFNLKFVQSAIVHKNRHAFVRSNPNFMFAGKKLHLPSINEIKNLIYKNKKKKNNNSNDNNKEIYFFGN